tara:strand:+ start:332 stop:523 length:192 start_codon:yes stop_codon:yes gene_type:complete
MSKKTKKDYKQMVEKDEKPSQEEALSNLRQNLEDYTKQAKYYSNMALKAQGAIEVLEQLVEGE